MTIDDYICKYPKVTDESRESIFEDFLKELMDDLKRKKFTKIPAAFRLVKQKNDKWNNLNEHYILNNRGYLGLDGFIHRLQSKVPELFEGGFYDLES